MPADKPSTGLSAPMGFLVAGSEMVSFTLLGLLLDYLFKTMPGFTIALTVLGFVAAFFQLVLMARSFNKKPSGSPGPEKRDSSDSGGG